MRVTEFLPLNEYTDLEQEKANIIQTISGLSATNDNDKVILDRIWRVLHSEDMDTTLSSAFNTPLSDEDMPDKTKEQHRVALTRIIGNLDSDYNALSNFITKLEKGGNNGVINVKALNNRVSSFTDVFTSPTYENYFERSFQDSEIETNSESISDSNRTSDFSFYDFTAKLFCSLKS